MKLGLIGEKLGHSQSGRIHAAYFAQTGAQGSYALIELPPSRVDCLRELMLSEGIEGLNITIPYKRCVMRLLDEVTPEAARIGAVNTVLLRGGLLFGHNTDAYGFGALLDRAGIAVKGRDVAVLGATGGAARAVLDALNAGGARCVHRVSRTGGAGLVNFAQLERLPFDVLVNATPVGTAPDFDRSPVAPHVAARARAAVDLIYNPPETRLLRDVRAAGGTVANGLYMLVAQAVAAQAFWRGGPVERALIDVIYEKVRAWAEETT